MKWLVPKWQSTSWLFHDLLIERDGDEDENDGGFPWLHVMSAVSFVENMMAINS
jgi:hypothetical protein